MGTGVLTFLGGKWKGAELQTGVSFPHHSILRKCPRPRLKGICLFSFKWCLGSYLLHYQRDAGFGNPVVKLSAMPRVLIVLQY